MTDPKALELGCQASGVTSRVPQLVVHQSALALRQLLDAGIPPEDPRCAALVQLVNSARLVLLPGSNNGARVATDLTSKAVHIDVSTATMAAIMGLKNASSLTGAALAEANKARIRNAVHPSPTSGTGLKMKLNPRLSIQAFNALVYLVRTDSELGERARRDSQYRSSAMAQKMNRLRAGQRHASVRKRRMSSDDLEEGGDESRDEIAGDPTALPPPPPPPPLPPAESGPIVPIHTIPGTSTLQTTMMPSHRQHIVLGPPVQIQPRTFAPLSLPPPPPVQVEIELSNAPQIDVASAAPPTQSFARFRPRPVPPAIPDKRMQQALAKDKGVMNDEVGTPDEVMEEFLKPDDRSQDPAHDFLDNGGKIRSVLAERERILYRLLKRRRAELATMPLGMTEQTRRNAIIEAKQLSLIELQRVVRYRVCTEMKKMYSLAIQEEGCVPADHLSRLFRRRDPPIYSYTDGYPRITPFDGLPEMPPRHPATVAQDSIRMAQFDMSRMAAKKLQTRRDFNAKLMVHFANFKNMDAQARSCRARIWKGIERYLLEKKRAEERRRKLERIERLKLLRSNDEQAYFQLLKNTKNERLLQLVRQTDSYLMRIGAQVERERVSGDGTSGTRNVFSEEVSDDAVPIESMRQRRDLYYTVTHAVQEEVRQPSIMINGTLKPYQVEGLKWMVSLYNNNLNGILADEMGLGKTIQTISLITYLVEVKKNPGPYLIIVPLSTMGNWMRELDLWAPSLVKVVYRGSKAVRRSMQQMEMASRDFNVLLTTYEFTVKDQHVLGRIGWKYIIIDEGHRMKNANCKLAMTLGVKYKSRNRLLLTGTPLQNNLTELWALLNFLLPSIFSSSDTFETWFKQPFESTTLGDTAELEEEETLLVINRLHQVLRPFLLRRLKTDVETQLPSKVEHVIHCDMSSWQRVIYRQVKNRVGLATGSHNGGVKAFNNLLMQCKKICNHPYLFYDSEALDFLPSDYLLRASGKFFLLQHMLPKLQLGNHRTLIFSQMTAALDYLEYLLSAIGVEYLRLDGNTRADDRQELLNRFNEKDSPYFCFLLSTRAGGLGLNLQTADTVIIFDSDWNPMMDLQAQDRAHRIGQTQVVTVFRLICSGTVEVKILEQANKKLQIDAQVIQAGQFNNKSTENDRHQMLKDLLRQKSDEDGLGDVPSMAELNRMFARTDGEYEEYLEYDKKTMADGSFRPLFTREDELPEWVLQPDVDHKTAEEKEKEVLLSHGRGRRKRKTTHDMDLLTEAEWFKVVEGDMSVEEAFKRRNLRKERRHNGRSKAEDDSTETEEEGGEVDPSTDETNRPSEDPEFSAADGAATSGNLSGDEAAPPEEIGKVPAPKSLENVVESSQPTAPTRRTESEAQGSVSVLERSGKKRRAVSSGMPKPKENFQAKNFNDNRVFVKLRVKRPAAPSRSDASQSPVLCNGSTGAKKGGVKEDGPVAEDDYELTSAQRSKRHKGEALVENPVAVEIETQANPARKTRRRPRPSRKKRQRSPSNERQASEDGDNLRGGDIIANITSSDVEGDVLVEAGGVTSGKVGAAGNSDVKQVNGEVAATAAVDTVGSAENGLNSETSEARKASRKRRKVSIISPNKSEATENEGDEPVLSNGMVLHPIGSGLKSGENEKDARRVFVRLRIREGHESALIRVASSRKSKKSSSRKRGAR